MFKFLMTSSLQAFHVMAKPTGARCNLECDYCFFLKKDRLYPDSDFRMSPETMEAYIRQTIEGHRIPEVSIAWQGGEPTLMGLDFFRRVVGVEQKYLKPGMRVLDIGLMLTCYLLGILLFVVKSIRELIAGQTLPDMSKSLS